MSSAPVAPIRQPRGPSHHSFSSTSPPAPPTGNSPTPPGGNTASGPPAADQETLKRANTVSNPRHHQASASISANPAASSAFHGPAVSANSVSSGTTTGSGGRSRVNRFRSGSLSAALPDPGLVRRGSGREVRKEVVLESQVEGEDHEMGGQQWNKSLSRQSSLPSRRGLNPVQQPDQPLPSRPSRRLAVNTTGQTTGATPPHSAHGASHSLSSLSMLSQPQYNNQGLDEPINAGVGGNGGGAGVSRTQSLRAQAKHISSGNLGRSTSLKAVGEHTYRPSMSNINPDSQPTPPNVFSPQNAFSPPTPPPLSSTAALPPFGLPGYDSAIATGPADVKRHQSLNQGYGSHSRVRDRLEKSPAVVSLEGRGNEVRQRLDSGRLDEDEPPTSPVGPSVWSNNPRLGDGWASAPGQANNTKNASQQLQDAFEAMNLGRKMMAPENGFAQGPPINGGYGLNRERLNLETNIMRHPHAGSPASGQLQRKGSGADGEPSWVNKLVGGDNTPMLGHNMPRSASAHSWGGERDRNDQGYSGYPGNYMNFNNNGYMPMPQNHQGRMMPPMPMPGMNYMGMPGYAQGFSGYIPNGQQLGGPGNGHGGQGQHAYPSPPASAGMGAQDKEVIELARKKGLNPATFECRPQGARFFVIKSYTEEDVQKSLKHEIWSSTVLGNKRLDAAYRENAGKGPIYLAFSVNGSRHFCGVAEMTTPVDETKTSKVWAQDKWKGIFEVKWIFVRDVPSAALRHIRLTNTPECKPITNSRDTQELPYEAGSEVLQIFLDHQTKSKTSLLQDFAYYEQLSANRQGPSPNGNAAQPNQMQTPVSAGGHQPLHLAPAMGISNGASVPPVPTIPDRFR
ncbi:hypothetical protein L202_01606 [Cryptococcus amylolentus CBS 6039]|uniref:YTH domain-containing protein n=1 Tax=Cryptococcus amylolentus CBS 6039 TaxID=1295533 RepID=A0A1E3I4H0_9TREE|nr:hypothetical protein L202_01606 [Cryptococcus amylolentus CBS 6039]ODN83469.1 hypothetical protein L202_01606 [Cryptococcus amylolentus CBS 6039]